MVMAEGFAAMRMGDSIAPHPGYQQNSKGEAGAEGMQISGVASAARKSWEVRAVRSR